MRAGKKQAAESVKTRPCIVSVRNLHEESPTRGGTPAGKLRKRDNQREAQQELRETRTRRRSVVQEKPTPRTRHAVKPASSPSPSPPSARSKLIRESVKEQQSSNLAKRRGNLLLGGGTHTPAGSHHKLGLLKPQQRRSVQSETPKMYKQPAAKRVSESPPPTIAASRSRRSIKPNPKYASEDMVTPKYMATLADGGGQSFGSRGRQAKQLFTNDDDISDLLELDEDDDDELADAAFNPQLHKSDEDDDDDDDEDMSEAEYEQELRRKQPPVKRGRGRPPKASNVNASTTTSSGATSKISINSSGGRNAPSSLQQMRRTMAMNMARSNASMTDGSGHGSGSATAKRKLDTSENESPVARKRMIISSAGGGNSQQRNVPVVNGGTSKTSAHSASTARPKMGQAGSVSARMLPQRRGSSYKMNSLTNSNSASSTPTTRSAGGGAASHDAKNESESEDVPTFTIVNIDDIINQDDVLISRSHNAMAAAAGGNPSKKLAVGRPRTKNIPSSNLGVGDKKSITVNSEKSMTAAASNNTVGNQTKRIKILASNSSVNTKMGPVHIQSHQSHTQQSKPRPRILNTEMGKKTQSMKPLMSMGKELCPTDVDTEEDDPDPVLDFDDDDIPASIVTRKNPKQAAAPAASSGAIGGHASAVNKWSSNRRNVLSTTASTVNARADRKLGNLLTDVDEQPVFKKPSLSPQRRSKENHQMQQDQRNEEVRELIPASVCTDDASSPQYFPPETTKFCEEDGRMVKKITCYETWHVISTSKESPAKVTRQQRTCLELPLVKLANVASRIKLPSGKWTSKVTLYKVSPSLMTRQTMTIFTGDLKAYNIAEEDRHKYQPSCVLFRRAVLDRSKCRVPYDRAIIFKNKCYYANIDGKHVNLMGAPEAVNTIKDVEILLDVVDRLSLSSALVEMVNIK
ncbi:uncharacterized protein LOC6551428 [Drosophila erecta]|uniref:Uncharacterized protein n=1 Tax=Drosophila erecta TaxID=7220 RepID=B3NUE7_DROER|nr:uncharacterized protein LOC6551428 [Drosophila erecta]EDV46062.1 uncharacterized protein Dere_GG18407 [Drosophila erecta]